MRISDWRSCWCVFCVRVCVLVVVVCFFFFKHKTAYEVRISDWSSDGCSSDLRRRAPVRAEREAAVLNPETVERQTMNRQTWAFNQIGRASCRERVCQYV